MGSAIFYTMKLYTSYFAQIRNFPPNLVGLSTTMWPPKWLHPHRTQNGIIWLTVPPLQPGSECEGLCAGKCNPKHPSDCAFLQTYYQQLQRIPMDKFIKKLEELAAKIQEKENFSRGVDFAFLVYETPNNPCSERAPLQKWFTTNNIKIQEWKKE